MNTKPTYEEACKIIKDNNIVDKFPLKQYINDGFINTHLKPHIVLGCNSKLTIAIRILLLQALDNKENWDTIPNNMDPNLTTFTPLDESDKIHVKVKKINTSPKKVPKINQDIKKSKSISLWKEELETTKNPSYEEACNIIKNAKDILPDYINFPSQEELDHNFINHSFRPHIIIWAQYNDKVKTAISKIFSQAGYNEQVEVFHTTENQETTKRELITNFKEESVESELSEETKKYNEDKKTRETNLKILVNNNVSVHSKIDTQSAFKNVVAVIKKYCPDDMIYKFTKEYTNKTTLELSFQRIRWDIMNRAALTTMKRVMTHVNSYFHISNN